MQPIVLKDGAKLYGYIRGSTDKQHNTAEAQTMMLRNEASAQGHPIELVFDNHISATKQDFEKRPGGRELLRRLRPGDVVLATRWDRLARRTRFAYVRDQLAARSIHLHTIEDDISDLDDYMAKFYGNLALALAEMEAGRISARIRETNAWRKSMGLPVNGRGKYGHKIVDGTKGRVFEVDKKEMELICEASERRLKGESARVIAEDFTERKLTSPLMNAKTG